VPDSAVEYAVAAVAHTHIHHGLRGSVSPMLTATGLVNEKWQFSAPYIIDTL